MDYIYATQMLPDLSLERENIKMTLECREAASRKQGGREAAWSETLKSNVLAVPPG